MRHYPRRFCAISREADAPAARYAFADMGFGNPERLDAATRAIVADEANQVLFSVASIWEIAIKSANGRLDFGFDPQEILAAAIQTGFNELQIRSEAAVQVGKLPRYHRDPFDRLLIAQAMIEPVRFYTADPLLPPYSELVILI
jgi:PIN domain nuclease of toxin-antitoxin system